MVLPKQEANGGYAQDSIGGSCSSSGGCIAIEQMKRFAATGMKDLVHSKQETDGGYAQDSIGGICCSNGGCFNIDKMKDFVSDIIKYGECKRDALNLIERYGNLL